MLISANELTATELKFVPSAISKLPIVFVAITISSPDTVRSPVTTKLPAIVTSSESLSPVTALLAMSAVTIVPSAIIELTITLAPMTKSKVLSLSS